MMFKFGEFNFEVSQGCLYRGHELIVLKRNQSSLLRFFLESPSNIHSKDAILDAVWKNQIVSEQVVFQTISQLRTILGANSIKTYSKKGYKWNNPVEKFEYGEQASKLKREIPKTISANFKWLSLLLCLTFLVVLAAYKLSNDNTPNSITFHLVNSSNSNASNFELLNLLGKTLKNKDFLAKAIESSFTAEQAFLMPKRAQSALNLSTSDWSFWNQIFESHHGVLAKYSVSNGNKTWQGFVEAKTLRQLTSKLGNRLQMLSTYGFFNTNLDIASEENLKKLLKKFPNDKDILLYLASHYSKIEHFDVALSYLEKVVKLEANSKFKAYSATAHWQMGKLYKIRGLNLQSKYSLQAMESDLEKASIWPLHFQFVKTKAWLNYAETDYLEMYDTLNKGLEKFNSIKLVTESGNKTLANPLALFKLHVLYSILANKVDDQENMYFHLHQAQALLLKYELDESHMAIVYYHLALFTKYIDKNNTEELLTYIEKTLEQPRTNDNFWVLDSAFELLINHRINQQSYQQALTQLNSKPQSAKWMLIKAKVKMLQGHEDEAYDLYEQAFETARIDYDIRSGIEAALKLYQLNDDKPSVKATYLAYLQSNTKQEWLEQNLFVQK